MISEQSKMPNIFDLDDDRLIEKFVQGSDRLLASANLRLETNGGLSQLMSKNSEPIAILYLQNKPRTAIVKRSSPFLEIIDRLLIEKDFVMFGDASRQGFVEYKHYVTPAGYRIWYTDPAILWKKWWPTERFQDKQRFNMNILVNFKNINLNAGTFTIKTIAGQLVVKRDDKVLWLAQNLASSSGATGDLQSGAISTAVEPAPVAPRAYSQAVAVDLVQKIQQKQSEIGAEQGWSAIKKLEEKLQAQIKINCELEAKVIEANNRSTIAEQRLQVVYNYLREAGVDPQEIYKHK
jgi:hypothetical protein